MAVRKKSSVGKSKKVAPKASKGAVSSAQPWYKKYMGWIIGGGIAYVVALVLFNLAFFRENIPAEYQVKLVKKITAMDSGSGSFTPGGIALWGEDKIAVSDTNSKRILIFNKEGKFLRFLGTALSNEEREAIRKGEKQIPEDAFQGLGGICVDETSIYGLDDQRNIVRGYGPNFRLSDSVNLRELSCYGPRSANYDGKNFLIADTGTHRVLVINRDAQVQFSFGKHGDGSGEMNNPVDVVADSKGRYLVADFDNLRAGIYDSKGKFQKNVKLGSRPTGVAVLKDGLMVATSPEGNCVKVFRDNGKLVGNMKEEKNDVTFTAFSNVRVDKDGLIYLAGVDTIVVVKPIE
jgi:DNA-binding beta-propeller fold protein YncE